MFVAELVLTRRIYKEADSLELERLAISQVTGTATSCCTEGSMSNNVETIRMTPGSVLGSVVYCKTNVSQTLYTNYSGEVLHCHQ